MVPSIADGAKGPQYLGCGVHKPRGVVIQADDPGGAKGAGVGAGGPDDHVGPAVKNKDMFSLVVSDLPDGAQHLKLCFNTRPGHVRIMVIGPFSDAVFIEIHQGDGRGYNCGELFLPFGDLLIFYTRQHLNV